MPDKKGTPEDPKATRPRMPAVYGVPRDRKGLLPWAHVDERMEKAHHYWVCTVDSEGRPHATPVDGLWMEGQLYFGGSPETKRHRNLAANPEICIHLESASDVVILHGRARPVKDLARHLTQRLADESRKKYGYGPSPEDYETSGVFSFRPRKVLAWRQFPKDATRWAFGEES